MRWFGASDVGYFDAFLLVVLLCRYVEESEQYIYDAVIHLVRCNPSGLRPLGRAVGVAEGELRSPPSADRHQT